MFWLAGCPSAFGAVDFDGTDDYVDGGDINAMDGLTSVTVTAWIKLAINSASGETHFVEKSGCDGMNDSGPFELYGGATANKAGFAVYPAGANPSTYVLSGDGTTTIDDGTWHHLAGTYDGVRVRLYVNGIEENSAALAGVTLSSNTRPFDIGGYCNNHGGYFGNGLIDDVRVYNRALSASEIEVIAKGRLKYDSLTTPGNGLVGYWPLDDSPDGTSGDGDTFVDRSGNGNNVTGVDGANNTGLTAKASSYLMYPAPVQ